MSEPIVGIDLGTSNTVVAHADAAGQVRVLADDSGIKIHPSVVSFHPNGGVIVGAAAKQRKVIDPQNTIYSVKRLIGRAFGSPEVQTARTRVPFQIKESSAHAPLIVTRGGEFAVPEISAIVLDHARNVASARIGAPVTNAVVTVPASFNDAQRSATATAGAIAGLTVVRVLNEPTAAALAYGHTRNLNEMIAVYDFGGGTFDLTILKLADQVYEVLGTAGDSFLGGDDLDERLVDKMVAKFLAENRVDLRTNEVAMMRLRAVAEQTKIELSRRTRAVVRVDEIAYGPRGAPLNLQIEIKRDELVADCADIIDRTFPVCREALQLAGLHTSQIADVVLVGGTTKIPYVRDQVAKFFEKPPRSDVNPEDAVAVGAALQATALQRILARRPSARQSVPPPVTTEDSVTAEITREQLHEDDPSGATMAPSELGRAPVVPARPRTTTERPDTSYSMTRKGVRDEYDGKRITIPPPGTQPGVTRPPTQPPVTFDTMDEPTPPPSSLPLGRITRPSVSQMPNDQATTTPRPAVPPSPYGGPVASLTPTTIPGSVPLSNPSMPAIAPVAPPAPPGPKTMFGVPAAPVLVSPDPRPDPVPPPLPPDARTMIQPPPMPPRATARMPELARPPSQLRATTQSPASTLPMAPQQPIAAPTAPTMAVAPAPAADDFLDVSPASTARGFEPPRAVPILPQTARAVAPPVVLEVTPRSLGIGTVAGFCEELIRRNSRVPAEMKKMFTTSRDRQDVVRIIVCQGESRRLDNNVVIGDLVLAGLPPRPRGETAIEVTFSLDASGILRVRARDAQTGAEQRASLDLVGNVAGEDVAASRDRIQRLRS